MDDLPYNPKLLAKLLDRAAHRTSTESDARLALMKAMDHVNKANLNLGDVVMIAGQDMFISLSGMPFERHLDKIADLQIVVGEKDDLVNSMKVELAKLRQDNQTLRSQCEHLSQGLLRVGESNLSLRRLIDGQAIEPAPTKHTFDDLCRAVKERCFIPNWRVPFMSLTKTDNATLRSWEDSDTVPDEIFETVLAISPEAFNKSYRMTLVERKFCDHLFDHKKALSPGHATQLMEKRFGHYFPPDCIYARFRLWKQPSVSRVDSQPLAA